MKFHRGFGTGQVSKTGGFMCATREIAFTPCKGVKYHKTTKMVVLWYRSQIWVKSGTGLGQAWDSFSLSRGRAQRPRIIPMSRLRQLAHCRGGVFFREVHWYPHVEQCMWPYHLFLSSFAADIQPYTKQARIIGPSRISMAISRI